MHPIRRYPRLVLFAIGFAAVLCAASLFCADTLPAQIDDESFWQLIESASEPSGVFPAENFISNEVGFQMVLPALQQVAPPGGAYLGVGPEQNFTYIVALKPKIAFIVDIRRQNMIEHLVYKAVFEMSEDRADFLSRLFSRKRPAGLSGESSARGLLEAYTVSPSDAVMAGRNVQEIKDLLVRKHKFALTSDDLAAIERVCDAFAFYGTGITYNSAYPVNPRIVGGAPMPNYEDIMAATDPQGNQRSYLATEGNYRIMRDMEMKNLLIPLVGDFGGPKTLRVLGQYLKDHSSIVTAFYTSNVEQYLFSSPARGRGIANGGFAKFSGNVATFPLDASSTFIRSNGANQGVTPGRAGMRNPNLLSSIQEILAAEKDGRIQKYTDVLSLSR